MIDSTAFIDSSARIGPGTRVEKGAVVNADVVIGANSYLSEGCLVSANCIIGDRVHVDRYVRLPWWSRVKSGTEVIGGTFQGYRWSTWMDPVSKRRMLMYGCEAHSLSYWTKHVRALCKRHKHLDYVKMLRHLIGLVGEL